MAMRSKNAKRLNTFARIRKLGKVVDPYLSAVNRFLLSREKFCRRQVNEEK